MNSKGPIVGGLLKGIPRKSLRYPAGIPAFFKMEYLESLGLVGFEMSIPNELSCVTKTSDKVV